MPPIGAGYVPAGGDAAHAFLDERLRADGASCTPAIAPDGNIEPAAGGRADAHPPPDDRAKIANLHCTKSNKWDKI